MFIKVKFCQSHTSRNFFKKFKLSGQLLQKQPPKVKKGVLRPQACNFIKKEDLVQVFPVNFEKFLRTPFLQNTSGRMLL